MEEQKYTKKPSIGLVIQEIIHEDNPANCETLIQQYKSRSFAGFTRACLIKSMGVII